LFLLNILLQFFLFSNRLLNNYLTLLCHSLVQQIFIELLSKCLLNLSYFKIQKLFEFVFFVFPFLRVLSGKKLTTRKYISFIQKGHKDIALTDYFQNLNSFLYYTLFSCHNWCKLIKLK